MNKVQALAAFWDSFGWDAYDGSSVPQDTAFPYITYEVSTNSFGDTPRLLSASLWYRSTGWAEIEAKRDEIWRAIGQGGVNLPYDDGALWIKRESAARGGDPDDDMIRRYIIQIAAEFTSVE